LYNWTLAAAFASKDGEVVPRGGTFALPFGEIEVAFDPAALRAGDRILQRFTSVSELEVEGLALRYRWPGIGAALAASTKPAEDAPPGRDMVAPRLQVPLTALLRVPHPRRALVSGEPLTATLELHLAWDAESVSIAGKQVPLESEPTAALALTFTGVPVMELELLGVLGRLSGAMAERPPLVSTTPYRPGLVPVVFVHGTASSPVRWAEVYNRLQGDPEIRQRFQFWFFQYDSGAPIALSALRLREALSAAVARLDPQGEDAAFARAVLSARQEACLPDAGISTGDQLDSSAKLLDELRLHETRDLFRRGCSSSIPVSRVVFVATPSAAASWQAVGSRECTQWLATPAHRPGEGPRPESRCRAQRIRADGSRQHVAAQPLHSGFAGSPGRAVHQGALDHRGRWQRPRRAGQRRRRRILERPHRRSRVRAGRAVPALVPGQPALDRSGATHPQAAGWAADDRRSARPYRERRGSAVTRTTGVRVTAAIQAGEGGEVSSWRLGRVAVAILTAPLLILGLGWAGLASVDGPSSRLPWGCWRVASATAAGISRRSDPPSQSRASAAGSWCSDVVGFQRGNRDWQVMLHATDGDATAMS
jgi:hypothetical protein